MSNPTPEQWRSIPGWEGVYEVSTRGRVRSLSRTIIDVNGNHHSIRSRIMKFQYRGGYKYLTLSHEGRRVTGWVHQIVAQTFLGHPGADEEVCHNDGNPSNNNLDNLRYDTRRGNAADRTLHGTEYRLNWTHCPHGHEYTLENILVKDGTRRCLTCHRCRSREDQRVRSGYYERRGLPLPDFDEVIKTYKPARSFNSRKTLG